MIIYHKEVLNCPKLKIMNHQLQSVVIMVINTFDKEDGNIVAIKINLWLEKFNLTIVQTLNQQNLTRINHFARKMEKKEDQVLKLMPANHQDTPKFNQHLRVRILEQKKKKHHNTHNNQVKKHEKALEEVKQRKRKHTKMMREHDGKKSSTSALSNSKNAKKK